MPATKNLFFIALIVTLAVPIGGMGIDICVPSLPIMTEYFQVHKSLIQMSISMYILGMATMQIMIGSISDSQGRRKFIMLALAIYCISSLCIATTHSISNLLIWRFIEGLAFGCMQVCVRSVAVDLFSGKELYKVINNMTTAWAVSPIISPAIGAYLQVIFGWQASFYFLAIYSGVMFVLVSIFVPETIRERIQFKFTHIKANYQMVITNRNFFAGMVCTGSVYSLIVIFAVASPFLIEKVLQYSVIQFGNVALLTGLFFFCGTITNRILINILPATKMRISLGIMFLNIIIMLIVSIYSNNIYFITLSNCIVFYLVGILFSNSFASNMAIFPKIPGISGGIMGSFILLFGTVFGTGLGMLLHGESQMPIALGYLCLFFICLMSFLIYKIPNNE